MTFYLLDHPNPSGPNYYTSRRKPLIGIVVHVTAGLEDIDLIGPDLSCENVCNYAATTTRDVSWHSGSDSDTWIDLLPYSYTAWQCIDYNSSTAGHEISKLTADWRNMPPEWVTRTITIAALGLGRKARENNIPIRKVTKADVDRAIANNGPPVGFISHHELDPDRRTDPGWVWVNGELIDTFPWSRFLSIAEFGIEGDKEAMVLSSEDKEWIKRVTPRASLLALTGQSNSVYDSDDAKPFNTETTVAARLTRIENTQSEILSILKGQASG